MIGPPGVRAFIKSLEVMPGTHAPSVYRQFIRLNLLAVAVNVCAVAINLWRLTADVHQGGWEGWTTAVISAVLTVASVWVLWLFVALLLMWRSKLHVRRGVEAAR